MWQWKAEISKAAPQLRVHFCGHASDSGQLIIDREGAVADNDDADADIVVTTYQVLENSKTSKCLRDRSWGRIVLDEMQEIRSSATVIARNCDKLKAGGCLQFSRIHCSHVRPKRLGHHICELISTLVLHFHRAILVLF